VKYSIILAVLLYGRYIECWELLSKTLKKRQLRARFLGQVSFTWDVIDAVAQLCCSSATRHSCAIPADQLGCAHPLQRHLSSATSGCCLLSHSAKLPLLHYPTFGPYGADVVAKAMALAPISLASTIIGFISFSFTLAIVSPVQKLSVQFPGPAEHSSLRSFVRKSLDRFLRYLIKFNCGSYETLLISSPFSGSTHFGMHS
jgi:hypothetical protein